jgi:hypothetical protein
VNKAALALGPFMIYCTCFRKLYFFLSFTPFFFNIATLRAMHAYGMFLRMKTCVCMKVRNHDICTYSLCSEYFHTRFL